MLIVDCKYRLIEKSHKKVVNGAKAADLEKSKELRLPLIPEETVINGGPSQKVQVEVLDKPKVSILFSIKLCNALLIYSILFAGFNI